MALHAAAWLPVLAAPMQGQARLPGKPGCWTLPWGFGPKLPGLSADRLLKGRQGRHGFSSAL